MTLDKLTLEIRNQKILGRRSAEALAEGLLHLFTPPAAKEAPAPEEVERVAWEGVRAMFEARHGAGTCPDERLEDLKAANEIGETWEEYLIACRAAIAAMRPVSVDGETQAARDVLAERERQKTVEGWTPEHDDAHSAGEMAKAAACYAYASALLDGPRRMLDEDPIYSGKNMVITKRLWPWAWGWWKPKDRRRDLVRAGALILAEIERIDRVWLLSAIEGVSHDAD